MADIQMPTTPNAPYLIGSNWPQESESSFIALSTKESGSSASAVVSSESAIQGAQVVSTEMSGFTSDAATDKYTNQGAKLENRAVNHSNKATTAGIAAQTIYNAKGNIVALTTSFETYAQTLADNPLLNSQEQANGEFNRKRDETRDQISGVYNNYKTAMDESLTAFKEGSDPSIPSTAPTAPPADAVDENGDAIPPMDTSGMESSVTSALSSLAGQGTQGLSSLTGQGGGQSTLDQALQKSPEIIKALSGQDGVPMTEEAFDKLMAGQDTGDSSGGDGPVDGPDDGPREDAKDEDRKENLPPPPPPPSGNEPNVTSVSNTTGGDAPASSKAPSPAEVPSSAPPPSAEMPSTTLSGDNNSPATSNTESGSIGSASTAPSSSMPKMDSGFTAQAPESAVNPGGTELSSSTSTATSPAAAPATSLAGAGANVAGGVASAAPAMAAAPVAAAAAPVAGAPMMGAPIGAGSSMAPTPTAAPPMATTPAAQAPASAASGAPTGAPPVSPLSGNAPGAAQMPLSPAAPTTGAPASVARMDSPMVAGVPPMAAAAIIGAPAGTLHHPSEKFSPNERIAGTYLNGVWKGYYIAKDAGNVAVALLPNGTAVYTTIHGCGYLPRGAMIPANMKPLVEVPEVSSLFVSDWTGCNRPGYVLRLAAQLGIIPEPLAIVAVGDKPEEGVTVLSPEQLKGTPLMDRSVTRADFGGVAESDMGEVFSMLDRDWGNHVVYAKARTDLILTEWDVNEPMGDSVTALARYILADAHESRQRGDIAGAQYALLRAIRLPSPDEI